MAVAKPKVKAVSSSKARGTNKPKAIASAGAIATKSAVKTVTLKQIAQDLAAAYELPKKTVESLFTDMTETIVKTIKKGSKVRISGIGILQVKKRAARMGRNSATGESIKIKASKKVSLSVARDLKETL